MTHRGKTFLSVAAITLAILGKLTPAQSQVVFGAFSAQTGDLASDPSCINGNALGNAPKPPTCAVVGADGGFGLIALMALDLLIWAEWSLENPVVPSLAPILKRSAE
jgi:hypothetical protein